MHALCFKSKVSGIALCIGLVLCPWSPFVCADNRPTRAEIPLKEILRTMNPDYVIKGTVTDQDGKLLSNVKLQITRWKATGPFVDSERKEERIVNERFEFTFPETSGVEMRFLLDGYRSVIRNLRNLEGDPGARIEGHTHYYDQVTVVLKKMGKITPLYTYDPMIKWNSASGAVTVWDVAEVLGEQAETKCVELPAIPGPERPCVYVRVAKSDVPISPLMEGRDELSPRDGSIEIVLQDGKQGGFRRVSPKIPTVTEVGVEVTTAPTDGYTAGFRLTKEDLAGLWHGAKVYFFVKLNGMYGKGYVNGMAYKPTSGIESCCLEIRLQPDGSTNVETRSW